MAGIEQKDKRLKRGYLVTLTTLIFLLGGLFFVYQGKASPAINGGGGGGGGREVECVITTWTESEFVRHEYKCESYECGANILHREKWRTRYCSQDSCTKIVSCHAGEYYYGSVGIYKTLESWLKCDLGGTAWQSTVPPYNCRGICVDTPVNPMYNGLASNRNVDLPVKMSWNHVRGFGNTVRKGPVFYNIKIDNTNADPEKDKYFTIEHGYSSVASFPVFASLPDLNLTKGSPVDGRFVTVNGEYRFIRPTPHSVRTITSCFGRRWRHWDNPPEWGLRNGIAIGETECANRTTRFGVNVCTNPRNTLIPIYAVAPGTITFAWDTRTQNPREDIRIRDIRSGSGGIIVTIDHSNHNFDLLSNEVRKETRYINLNALSGSTERGEWGPIQSGDSVTTEGEIWGTRQVGVDRFGNPIFRHVRVRRDNIIGWMGSSGISVEPHLYFEIRLNGQAVDPLSLITIPEQIPWVGIVPCLAESPTTNRGVNPLAAVPGDKNPYDKELENYAPAKPPFSFQEKGNPFSVNIKPKSNHFLANNCLLKRSDSHNWSVQACCNWNGTECGARSSWKMYTSDKVEILKQGVGDGTSSNPEVVHRLEDANLRWCEVKKKESIMVGGKKQDVFFQPERYEVIVEQKLPRFQLWGLSFFQRFQIHPLVQAMGGFILLGPPDRGRAPTTYVKNENVLLFTKSSYANYRWRVRVCTGKEECGDYTANQYFKVSEKITVDPPHLRAPSNDPQGNNEIGWPVNFRWDASLGANSYEFEIWKGQSRLLRKVIGSSPREEGQARAHEITLPIDNFKFTLNTLYRWRVRSCWDTAAKPEFCEKEWSERHFKTTGRPPKLESPAMDAEVLIPFQLNWERVPGAGSYILNLNGKEIVVINNYWDARFPDFKPNTTYTWSVKTCNDARGEFCGNLSEIGRFKTLALKSPQNLMPLGGDYFSGQHSRINLLWDKVLGAHYYEVSVSCGEKIIFREIISQREKNIPLTCVGRNDWTVRACVDKNCEHAGLPSQGYFIFHEGEARTGFVPCGLKYNNPVTEWNERDTCELRHIFIMLKIILDFVFWQLMPIILVIMVIVSGLTFYLSLGNPNIIAKIKSIWSSVGKGLLIMFFGWTAINIIMTIMGYNFGIFGPWWQVSF